MEEKIIKEILSLKRDNINELLELLESPIEKLLILYLLKYFEKSLSTSEFFSSHPNQIGINGFHYITEDDPLNKNTWGKIIGISINYFTVGFTLGRGVSGKTNHEKRVPNLLKAPDGNSFTQMQMLHIIPQYKVQIGSSFFRLDFAFLLYENIDHDFSLVKKIGVECDGYEYHSDKNQFKKDRERLRKLELDDWVIIPFSGSEINRYQYNKNEFPQEIFKILSLLGFGFHSA
jgi:hypothetical protein